MAEVQLRLFPAPKPLLERFGAEFFRRVPTGPGVYLMSGEQERLLYVGQSQNLRTRLNSYKNLQPERASRKLVRLVHAVRSITWEPCESATAARCRENELLRRHKPRFNVVNTRPEFYRFVGLRVAGRQLGLRVTRAEGRLAGERLYGAFKGSAGWACAALGRLLWSIEHRPRDPVELPVGWTRPWVNGRIRLELRDVGRWFELADRYFAGESDGIAAELETSLSGEACPFIRAGWIQDLATVRDFFRSGPARVRQIRSVGALDLIRQEELDDLLVLVAPDPPSSFPPQALDVDRP